MLKEFQEKVWLKDKVMNDFKTNAEEAIERANELDKSLEEKTEDVETKDERIAKLTLLVNEMKSELARNNAADMRRELDTREGIIRELRGKVNIATNEVERNEQELEELKKASEDLQFMASTLEEKEYDVTKLEALNSDLRTQITFKDEQLADLQKVNEEQKVICQKDFQFLDDVI